MRIITTFNDRLYDASGRDLLASIRTHLPHADLLVYEELDQIRLDVPTVAIRELPELAMVRENHRDVLASEYGGTADTLTGFNRRWYGWFHKIVAQYDALIRRPTEGLTLFLDCDIRVLKPFDANDILSTVQKPVGVMRGRREAVESGIITFDESTPGAAVFVQHVMNLFLDGSFRDLARWDDGFVYGHCLNQYPQFAQDVAAGLTAVDHTNSNGHATGGQILPVTPWAPFFEHDKGVHWRKGVAPDINAGRRATLASRWSDLWSRLRQRPKP